MPKPDPQPVKCPRCTRGTWIDANGSAWRCYRCNGTGTVRADDEPKAA